MSGIGLTASLYMGARSLNVQRLAIQIAGHNISNVNTPNYTRQRAAIATDITVQLGIGQQGLGVTANQIQAIRDRLIDKQIVTQQSLGGFYEIQSRLANNAQAVLGDQMNTHAAAAANALNTQSGIQTDLDRFFDSWHALSTDPTSTTLRRDALENGKTLAADLNSIYTRLQLLRSDMATQAGGVTTQINDLATQVAALNQKIFAAETGSQGPANDLRDTRQQRIEEMSRLVNINVTETANGMMNINLTDAPAVALVNGVNGGGSGSTESLSTSFNAAVNPPLTVIASVTGSLGGSAPSSGNLGAHLRVVNQTIGSPAAVGNTGLLGQLDTLANSIVTLVNAQHALGFDSVGTAGGNFFNPALTSAGTIQVSAAIAANTALIAAGNGTGPQSGSNAISLAALRENTALGAAYRATVSDLGSTVQLADRQDSAQKLLLEQLANQRISVTGVNVDEEITDLAVFQRAYEASARFISVINEMFSYLITATRS